MTLPLFVFFILKCRLINKIVFKKHKVKRGESFWRIAIKYGTTITAICEANKLNRDKPLREGKIITVPIGNYKSPPN